MEQPLKLNSLEKVYKYVADAHNVNQSSLKTNFSNFVADIFHDTDKIILKKIFTEYQNIAPSPSDFFIDFMEIIRELIETKT